MPPPTIPPPSLLPYLSSSQAGWDGLLAQATHELPEIEGHTMPGQTDITLSLITGGQMQWECREAHAHSAWESVHLRPGDFVLGTGTNLLYEQRWRSLSPAPIYSFTLRLCRNLLVRTVAELAGGDAAQLLLVGQAGFQDPFLLQMALSLRQELQEGAPSGKLFAQCAAQLIMLHLVRHYACSGHVPAVIQEPPHTLTPQQLHRVTTYMRDHASEDLTLQVLAHQTGFSPSHFARLFRQTTGESPHQVVRRERLVVAQRLLASTNLPLAQVAAESGFGNQSYFTRIFTSFLRVTPRAYRRECRI
jgi:AraC family transcriptional regulator